MANLKRHQIPLRDEAARRRPCSPKYGTKVVKDRTVVYHTEQRAIEVIVDLRRQGLNYSAIAKTLTTLKIPTKKRGKAWDHKLIKIILGRACWSEALNIGKSITMTIRD